jgi:hypothetical protein
LTLTVLFVCLGATNLIPLHSIGWTCASRLYIRCTMHLRHTIKTVRDVLTLPTPRGRLFWNVCEAQTSDLPTKELFVQLDSGGATGVGKSSQLPSIRADAKARHPRLHMPRTTKQHPGERLHLTGGPLRKPGHGNGTLTPDTERTLAAGGSCHDALAGLSCAPAGMTPSSRERHKAINNLRARATMLILRRRLPPLPKRSLYQRDSSLSG